MSRIVVAALAAVSLCVPAAAFAGAATETSTRAVSSAGLDLSRSADAKIMAGRVDTAALTVCGASEFSARDVQADVRKSGCYRAAVDRALAALSAPAVSAALKGHALALN